TLPVATRGHRHAGLSASKRCRRRLFWPSETPGSAFNDPILADDWCRQEARNRNSAGIAPGPGARAAIDHWYKSLRSEKFTGATVWTSPTNWPSQDKSWLPEMVEGEVHVAAQRCSYLVG